LSIPYPKVYHPSCFRTFTFLGSTAEINILSGIMRQAWVFPQQSSYDS
jgi:hypothetical protein